MDHNTDERLAFFTSAISADADGQAKRIMAEVQAESEQQMSAAEDQFLNETYRFIKNEVSRIRTDMRRTVSHKMLESKREIYAEQHQMFENIRQELDQKIAKYTQTSAYIDRLIASLKALRAAFGSDQIEVYLRPADKDKAKQLQTALNDKGLTFREGSFKLGGLLCQCPAKHWQIDDTFDTRYKELNKQFSLLLGESD